MCGGVVSRFPTSATRARRPGRSRILATSLVGSVTFPRVLLHATRSRRFSGCVSASGSCIVSFSAVSLPRASKITDKLCRTAPTRLPPGWCSSPGCAFQRGQFKSSNSVGGHQWRSNGPNSRTPASSSSQFDKSVEQHQQGCHQFGAAVQGRALQHGQFESNSSRVVRSSVASSSPATAGLRVPAF